MQKIQVPILSVLAQITQRSKLLSYKTGNYAKTPVPKIEHLKQKYAENPSPQLDR